MTLARRRWTLQLRRDLRSPQTARAMARCISAAWFKMLEKAFT